MPGAKLKAIILMVMAIILASGSIGAAYACYETFRYAPHHPGQVQKMDLKICDQDETWDDGVRATWTASNMAPGDEYAFDGHFIGLRSQFPCNIHRGLLGITCKYDAWTTSKPDKMAKYMVITGCVYSYTDKNDTWQINCLTGKATKTSKKGKNLPAVSNWRIQDVDKDGRVTFYDLKKRPLKNLPSFPGDEARFEMSVMFHRAAGNEFQGDTFNLTMIYTLAAG